MEWLFLAFNHANPAAPVPTAVPGVLEGCAIQEGERADRCRPNRGRSTWSFRWTPWPRLRPARECTFRLS